MRLINAFELKQRILEERDKIPLTLPGAVYELGIEKPNHHGNAMRGGIRKALRCMEQCHNYTLVDTVNQTQRWIPVSERLPDTFGEYVVTVKRVNGEVYSDYADYDLFQKRWTTGLFFEIGSKVTHWMPLPEPPQEE